MTSVMSERRVISGEAVRGDLLVHALAQLPDDVALRLPTGAPGRARLELLARAYGIADRICFGIDDGADAQVPADASFAELVEAFAEHDRPAASDRDPEQLLTGHRIAVVVNLPIHYRVALFASVAQRLEETGATFQVFFLARPPSTRAWMRPGELSFDHEFLRGVDLRRDRGRQVVPLDLEVRLARFAPTMVVAGGFSPLVAGRAARFARRRRIPFGVWAGEIPSRPTAQSRLRNLQRRRLLSHASFGISYGHLSGEYLRSLREDLPLVYGRNTTPLIEVDLERRTSGRVELLTVARAEESKRLDLVIDAVRLLPEESVRLTVVGDGPQIPALRARAARDPRIRFLGAVPSDQMQAVYSAARVFLFPSEYDIFGLVLVEALSAGLAVVSSTAPGAVADLAVDEHNCLLVASPEAAAWARAIERVTRDARLRSTLGAAAGRTVRSRWTIEHAADALLAGFRLGVLTGQGAST